MSKGSVVVGPSAAEIMPRPDDQRAEGQNQKGSNRNDALPQGVIESASCESVFSFYWPNAVHPPFFAESPGRDGCGLSWASEKTGKTNTQS